METEINMLVNYLASDVATDPKEWKNVKEKVQSKADICLTVGATPDSGGSSTMLLQLIKGLHYPQHWTAGILLMHQQSKCLPADTGIRSTFLKELNRLIRNPGLDGLVQIATTTRSLSSSSSGNGSSGNGEEGEGKKDSELDALLPSNPWFFLSKEFSEALEFAVVLLSDVLKQPTQGIEMLFEGTRLLRPRDGCLTAADGMLLRLCVEAEQFDYAAAYLDSQLIFEIDPKISHLEPVHYLAFFSTGGIVYMAKRQYAKALEYFESAITIPSKACSEISLSAYKKASLLSLVHTGKPYTCPDHTDSVVKGKVRKAAKDYAKVSELFAKGDRTGLAKHLVNDEVKRKFLEDGNYGLVLHVLSVLQDRAVSDLKSTYKRLSIRDIAEKIGAQSVEHARQDLEKLISSGRVQGSIDASTGMVTFGSSQGESVTEVDLPELLERVQETVQLSQKLRDIKMQVLTSKEYVKRTASASVSRVPGLGLSYSAVADLGDLDPDEMDVDLEM